MTKVKEDLRIVKTRKNLCHTLLRMLQKESIEKITVMDICDTALVNRTTFYTHFEDKYHLLSVALDELKDELFSNLTDEICVQEPREMLRQISYTIIDYLDNKKEKIKIILEHNKGEKIIDTVRESVDSSIHYLLSKYKNKLNYKLPLTIISTFFTGGLSSITLWWLQDKHSCPKEELKNYVNVLLDENIYTIK